MKNYILSLFSQTLLSPHSNQFNFLATCIETAPLLTLYPPHTGEILILKKQLSKSYQPPSITFLPHASHSPQSEGSLESCMHIFDSHFKNPLLSHLNVMGPWSPASASSWWWRNDAPYSGLCFTIIYFCFPAAVLPQIHVQGGKCTCLSSFLSYAPACF